MDCLVCNDPNIGAKKEVKTTILEVVLAALGSLACTKKLQVWTTKVSGFSTMERLGLGDVREKKESLVLDDCLIAVIIKMDEVEKLIYVYNKSLNVEESINNIVFISRLN